MVPPLTASLVVEALLAAVRSVHWAVFAPERTSAPDGPLVRGCEAAAAAASSSQAALESALKLAAEAVGRKCPPTPSWCSSDGAPARACEALYVAFAFALGVCVGAAIVSCGRRVAVRPLSLPREEATWTASPSPRSTSSSSDLSRRRPRAREVTGDPLVLAHLGLVPTPEASVLTPKTRHGGARLGRSTSAGLLR